MTPISVPLLHMQNEITVKSGSHRAKEENEDSVYNIVLTEGAEHTEGKL